MIGAIGVLSWSSELASNGQGQGEFASSEEPLKLKAAKLASVAGAFCDISSQRVAVMFYDAF
jgi:hypothetical protein